jgi:hypothetical protein
MAFHTFFIFTIANLVHVLFPNKRPGGCSFSSGVYHCCWADRCILSCIVSGVFIIFVLFPMRLTASTTTGSHAMEGGEERRMHSMEEPCMAELGSVSIRSEQILLVTIDELVRVQ